ncbi:universal stress protein [Rhodococcus sp. 3Y1]
MTLLAGYAPDGDSSGTVHLATLLARSSGEPLVICAVIPSPPPPGMARVDAEYHQQLRAEAEAALAKARADMPSDVDVTYVVHEAQSASSGLLDLVHEHEAKMIVLDSSTAGVFGHVALGSVTSRLLHSSDVPVALAPRGFRTKPGEVVRRVTAAYSGTPDQDDLVLAAATVAARVDAGLRLAAFAVRANAQYTTTLGTEGIHRSSLSGPRWSSARPTLPSSACVHCPKYPTSWNRLSAMVVTGPRRSRASSGTEVTF